MFAIDLREDFDPVFEQAVEWATRLGATLDLVYVGLYHDIYQFISDPHVRSLMATEAERARDEYRAELQGLLDRIPAENRGEAHLLAGPPATTITSREEPYDALLVATHGRTGVAHLWLGSVAERIVRTSKKPVIVLRLPRSSD